MMLVRLHVNILLPQEFPSSWVRNAREYGLEQAEIVQKAIEEAIDSQSVTYSLSTYHFKWGNKDD